MNSLSFVSSAVVIVVAAVYILNGNANEIKKCASNISRNHEEVMNSKRDELVAPCNDFYGFACGNWQISHELRTFGARDTLTAVKAENLLLLSNYFETVKAGGNLSLSNLSDSRKQLVKFYNSCQYLPTDQQEGYMQTYADVLLNEGGLSVLEVKADGNSKANFSWEHLSGHMRSFGANSFWQTLVKPNWQNAQQLILYIVPPSFDFLQRSKSKQPIKNYTDDEELFMYNGYIKYVFLDMGVRVRQSIKYADEIVAFELKLRALTLSNNQSVVLRAPQSLQTLLAEFSDMNLEKYFHALLQDIDLPVDYREKLLVAADKAYLRKLANVLNSTDNETIGRYLLIQFLSHFELNLFDESFKTRSEHCLEQANTFLADELSKTYLDVKHKGEGSAFLKQTQQSLNDMFENVKNYFEKLINATNVFDHNFATRTGGIQKLRAMQLTLPDLDLDAENEISNIGDEFSMSENFGSNLLKLYKLQVRQELIALNSSLFIGIELDDALSPNDHVKLMKSQIVQHYGPLNVNAYYRLKKNSIEIPVGLLALPLYDNCLEAPMVYGTIAYIVGHELLHGFDYDGLNYDKSGNIAEGWDPKSIIAFGSKASCYLGSRYNDAYINVNENIADSEGLRLALGALEMQSGQLTPSKLKLFFISFAQVWCRASSAKSEHHTLHATHQERVNNVLSNFAEFSETFNCKENNAMNPAEKCRIW